MPIYVAGEVTGRITRASDKGLSGIKIYFKSKETGAINSVFSITGGDYDLLALVPGNYEAYLDPVQLAQMNLRSDPPMREFTIRAREDGDIVENINFRVIQ